MDLGRLYREESGKILATLIRLLGGFDLAEEVLQEAFAVAVEQWTAGGVPANPTAWLVSTARFKAIDRLRRDARFAAKQDALVAQTEAGVADAPEEATMFDDDRLRLIFTCCHPALAVEAQIALTLRTLCGLSTDEIARAFLVPTATMAQRLVRAKAKIAGAGIPYEVPGPEQLAERLDAVLVTIYLVFTSGYAATPPRRALCAEAIRLGRILRELLPRAETHGLLALMLLHDSRSAARVGDGGDLVLLEEQDRTRWDRAAIDEGLALVEQALREGPPTRYAVEAAIAALHAQAARPDATDWRQIAALYAVLRAIAPSPVVELNRAVAIAMADGPSRGLAILDELARRGALDGYSLLHAARADLLRRLQRFADAAAAYRRALELAPEDAERRFLERRLREVSS